MQQIKIFKRDEDEIQAMEEEVNNWIRETGAEIISISGNIAPQTEPSTHSEPALSFPPSDVLLIVLYKAADSQ